MRSLVFIILSQFFLQASAEKPVLTDELAQHFAEKCVALAELKARQEGIKLVHPTQSIIVAADPSISIVIILGTVSSPWKHGGLNSGLIRVTHTCQNGEIQ
ncbi:MAG: hypothetical protein K2Q26_12395 [Bdellovibrionales bacterium]|nr:hypothetical protein [Bdellovibrionales bacterium]